MARKWVTKQDAVVAVFLVDASTTDGGLRHLTGAPGTTFAADPDADYRQLVRGCQGRLVQCKLGCHRRSWSCRWWRLAGMLSRGATL